MNTGKRDSWLYTMEALEEIMREVKITETDCGTKVGRNIMPEHWQEERIWFNRYPWEIGAGKIILDVQTEDGEIPGLTSGAVIDNDIKTAISDNSDRVMGLNVRSPLYCRALFGLCAKCMGHDDETYKGAQIGDHVGRESVKALGLARMAQRRSRPDFVVGDVPYEVKSKKGGTVRFGNLSTGMKLKPGKDHHGGPESHVDILIDDESSSNRFKLIIEETGETYELTNETRILVENGGKVNAGVVIARQHLVPQYESSPESLIWASDLLEAKVSDQPFLLSEISGNVHLIKHEDGRVTFDVSGAGKSWSKTTERGVEDTRILVTDGQTLEAGDALVDGDLDIRQVLNIKGQAVACELLLYHLRMGLEFQRIHVADRYLELIIRQMFSWLKIDDPGAGPWKKGDMVQRDHLVQKLAQLLKNGKNAPTFIPLIFGVSKIQAVRESGT